MYYIRWGWDAMASRVACGGSRTALIRRGRLRLALSSYGCRDGKVNHTAQLRHHHVFGEQFLCLLALLALDEFHRQRVDAVALIRGRPAAAGHALSTRTCACTRAQSKLKEELRRAWCSARSAAHIFSPLNTCPRWPPHARQVISIRCIPPVRSTAVSIDPV